MRTAKPSSVGYQTTAATGRRHVRGADKPLQQPTNEPSTVEEECPFDKFTPEEVNEFNACMDEAEEGERKLKRSSYRPQPEGMTVDDLVERIEERAASGETFAD